MSTKTGGTTMERLANGGMVQARRAKDSSLRTRVGRFVRHYLEMCASMCIGFGIGLALLFWAAGQLGYSAPFSQLPELSVLVVAFSMTAPMVAWMRYRRMEWRPIWEMAAAMVLWAILLLGAGWLGLLDKGALALLEHNLMMPIMLVPMLFRLDLYTADCH